MLDRLKPLVRHWVIMIIAVIMTTVLTDLRGNIDQIIPHVFPTLPPFMYTALAGVASSALGTGVLYFTKLTRQYGSGSLPVLDTAGGGMTAPDVTDVNATADSATAADAAALDAALTPAPAPAAPVTPAPVPDPAPAAPVVPPVVPPAPAAPPAA